MFINILFTGKLGNELFTFPLLFTRDAIHFRGILNHLDSLEETRYANSKSRDFSYAKLKFPNLQMTTTNVTSSFVYFRYNKAAIDWILRK